LGDVRLDHLARFYALLDRLERNVGGARTLADCSGRIVWPRRGVYFFQEEGELRTDTGRVANTWQTRQGQSNGFLAMKTSEKPAKSNYTDTYANVRP